MCELRAAAAVTAFALMVCVCQGATEDCSYVSLFRYLNLNNKTSSQVHVRPVKNWTTISVVRVNLVVYGIIEVNAKAQTFTCKAWESTYWKNEFLRWDPALFCGIKKLDVAREMMWLPDLIIEEDASDSGSTIRSRDLLLYADGSVIAASMRQLKAICQMHLYRFPMDIQRCNITVGSFSTYGIQVSQLQDSNVLTSISEQYMSTKGEWEFAGITVMPVTLDYDGQKTSGVIYQITLKRRPMLYMMNCILPLFYFLMLDMGTFFISEARGEKLSLKVTLLLSISVLLLILQDILPSTTDQLPLIALYSIVIFSLMAISLMEAMLVSFLMDMDHSTAKPDPAPSCVTTETEVKAPQPEPSGGAENPEEEQTEHAKAGNPDHFLLKLILKEVMSVRQEVLSETAPGDRKLGCYGRLARKIDVTFFWVYLISNAGFIIYMYVIWMEET